MQSHYVLYDISMVEGLRGGRRDTSPSTKDRLKKCLLVQLNDEN